MHIPFCPWEHRTLNIGYNVCWSGARRVQGDYVHDERASQRNKRRYIDRV